MSFAYLFERFPSFVQTFCVREAGEMVRQGMHPLIVSIRRPDDPPELADAPGLDVLYLPEEKELRAEIDCRRSSYPRAVRQALSRQRLAPDSQRLFEAAWLAPLLREGGLRHVHAHFGGLAARTAWWLRELFGFSYSFTGHANDIFCENDFPVTNARLVRDAVFVVTETDFARRWMKGKYPFARGKVFRVFNGIETAGFPERQPLSSPPRLLSVGRYVEKKGFADLIEACRLLRSEGRVFTCDLAGGGQLQADLQARIDAAGLSGCVTLLGPRPQGEVRELLARATAFVLACVPEAGGGSDNLPTVIMEAMAAGVPVVSTRMAGVPEMITHGVEGLLVSPQAPAELAGALGRLLDSPGEAAQFAEAGQGVARERFAVERTTQVLKHLLVSRAEVVPPAEALGLDAALAGAVPGLLRKVRLRLMRR